MSAMKLFNEQEKNSFSPTPHARGPFAGLQGGAVASVLCAQLEQLAAEQGLGEPVSISASFLRATPFELFSTKPEIVWQSSRVAVLRNQLSANDKQCAIATLSVMNRSALVGISSLIDETFDPLTLSNSSTTTLSRRDHQWLMDIFDVRPDLNTGIVWFGVAEAFAAELSPMEMSLLAADWTHGINRPRSSGYADPNINLNVHFVRPLVGRWIGVKASTHWSDGGIGIGQGSLWDVQGRFGTVSMSVAISEMP